MTARTFMFTCYDLESFKVPDEDPRFRYCIYQGETCPQTGRLHLQGYIEFRQNMRFKAVTLLCDVPTMHISKRYGTQKQAIDYVTKKDTRWSEPVEFGTKAEDDGTRLDLTEAKKLIQTKETLDDIYMDHNLDHVTSRYPNWVKKQYSLKPQEILFPIKLYAWQEPIMALLRGPPIHRRIIWIWSQQSLTGKTTFMEHVSENIRTLKGCDDIRDLLYLYDNHKVVWFDLCRNTKITYQSLEELSNHGRKNSTKYEPMVKLWKPHLVVTANRPPDEELLPNRFVIFNCDSEDQ